MDKILKITGITDFLAVYQYGSRVYGTARPDSDYDFVVVANTEEKEYNQDNYNIHVLKPETFQQKLHDHDNMAIECHFLPARHVLISHAWDFTLDRQKLRHAFSAKASNSFVKCKKKLTVETGQEWIGIKSMFHSIRIINFGIQLAVHERIKDYGGADYEWLKIRDMAEKMEVNNSWSWEVIHKEFKPIYNQYMSEFRKVAEK